MILASKRIYHKIRKHLSNCTKAIKLSEYCRIFLSESFGGLFNIIFTQAFEKERLLNLVSIPKKTNLKDVVKSIKIGMHY